MLSEEIELLTVEEVSSILKIPVKTIYMYTCNSGVKNGIKRNRFPSHIYRKLGRSIRFIKSELIEWIKDGANFE